MHNSQGELSRFAKFALNLIPLLIYYGVGKWTWYRYRGAFWISETLSGHSQVDCRSGFKIDRNTGQKLNKAREKVAQSLSKPGLTWRETGRPGHGR